MGHFRNIQLTGEKPDVIGIQQVIEGIRIEALREISQNGLIAQIQVDWTGWSPPRAISSERALNRSGSRKARMTIQGRVCLIGKTTRICR
jgi:hypothetical protein